MQQRMGDENLFDFESMFFENVEDKADPGPRLGKLDIVNSNRNSLKRVRFDNTIIDKAIQKPFKRKRRNLDSELESKQETKADYSMLMVDGQLKRFCELCEKIGKSSRLKLYQVNFDEAFYMCENIDCSYPLDIEESCSQSLVNRDYRNITTASQRRLASVSKNPLIPLASSVVSKTPLVSVSSSASSKTLPLTRQTSVVKQPLRDTPVNIVQNKSVFDCNNSKLSVTQKPNLNLTSLNGASKFQPFQLSKAKSFTAKSVASNKSAKTDSKIKSTPVAISEVAAELLKKRRSRSRTPDSSVSSEGSASKRQRINNIFKEALQSKQVKTPKDRVSPLTCSLAKRQTSVPSVRSAKTDSALVSPKGKGVKIIQQILKDVKEKTPPSVLGASKFAPFSLASKTTTPVNSKPGKRKKDNLGVQELKSKQKSVNQPQQKSDTSTPKTSASKPKLLDSDILKAISKRLAAKKDSGPIRKIVIQSVSDKKRQNAVVQVQNQANGTQILKSTSKPQLQSARSTLNSVVTPQSGVSCTSDRNSVLTKSLSEDSQNFEDYCDSFDISLFDDIVDQQSGITDPANSDKANSDFVPDWEGTSDGHSLNSSGNSSPKHSPYNKSSVDFDSLFPDSQLDQEVSSILSSETQSLYAPKARSKKKSVGSCIQKQVVKQLQNIVDKSYLQALRTSPVELDESGQLSASISLNALGESDNLIVITDSVDNLVSSEITCEVIETGR